MGVVIRGVVWGSGFPHSTIVRVSIKIHQFHVVSSHGSSVMLVVGVDVGVIGVELFSLFIAVSCWRVMRMCRGHVT